MNQTEQHLLFQLAELIWVIFLSEQKETKKIVIMKQDKAVN